jgi:hypothetical protein
MNNQVARYEQLSFRPASSDTDAVGGAARCHFVHGQMRGGDEEGSNPETEGAHEARDKLTVGFGSPPRHLCQRPC